MDGWKLGVVVAVGFGIGRVRNECRVRASGRRRHQKEWSGHRRQLKPPKMVPYEVAVVSETRCGLSSVVVECGSQLGGVKRWLIRGAAKMQDACPEAHGFQGPGLRIISGQGPWMRGGPCPPGARLFRRHSGKPSVSNVSR